MAPEPTAPALVARGVTQRFGGALALNDVAFEVRGGEIHALLGENGAGKSTLVKVLTGALTPTAGEILIDGEVQSLRSPRQAQSAGIGTVYQDFHLFPHLTVAENMWSASLPPAIFGVTSRRRMYASARDLLESFGIDVDPRRRVGTLDAAERKLIEISRALLLKPRYLILDEPTAALEPRETVRLLTVMQTLRERGAGVILVTHRLGEVVEVADRATALRNGLNVGTLDRSAITTQSLAHLIVGQEVNQETGPEHAPREAIALSVTGLSVRPGCSPVEVNVHEGELVGVIGLVGAGVSQVMNVASGAIASKATVTAGGASRRFRNRIQAQRAGIGAVPVDRKAAGLVLEATIAENVGLASFEQFSRLGFTRRRSLRQAAKASQGVFDIRCRSVDQPVSSLSGGNQQKVMLGRWHLAGSPILVIQEPSQGVDIGARQEIHRYLIDYARGGGAVLFSSSDLDEVRTLAHRIYVMHGGVVVAEFDNGGPGAPSRRELTHAMAKAPSTQEEDEVLE